MTGRGLDPLLERLDVLGGLLDLGQHVHFLAQIGQLVVELAHLLGNLDRGVGLCFHIQVADLRDFGQIHLLARLLKNSGQDATFGFQFLSFFNEFLHGFASFWAIKKDGP